MPIDHFGLGVPDVDVAKAYYDEFMPLVGFEREWETGYRATDWYGAQIFLYPTLEDGDYSRHRVGLQHISFYVPTRADVHRVYEWAKERGHEIVSEPKLFPEYNPHFYATFFRTCTASCSRPSPTKFLKMPTLEEVAAVRVDVHRAGFVLVAECGALAPCEQPDRNESCGEPSHQLARPAKRSTCRSEIAQVQVPSPSRGRCAGDGS